MNGQGCNSSLENVQILGQLLDQDGDDWGKGLPVFSQQRVPYAHALSELSNDSFRRTKWLMVEFFFRLTTRRLLHGWLLLLVKSFVFDLVLDADLSYLQVLNVSQEWINQVKRSMGKI